MMRDFNNNRFESPLQTQPASQPANADFTTLIHELIHDFGVYPDYKAMQKKYKEAVLKDYGGDVNKRWCVEWWIWSHAQNKLVRKRKWLRQADTAEQRRIDAQDKISFLNRALAQGLITPDSPADVIDKKGVSLDDMLDRVLEMKKQENRKLTMGSYLSVSNNLKRIFGLKGGVNNVLGLKKIDIIEYLNDRQAMDGIKNPTRNKELSHIKVLFNYAIQLGLLKDNPCAGIAKLREEVGKDRVYTTDECDLLRKKYKEKWSDLLLYSYFVYYCYMRPRIEVRLMKVSHLNMQDRMVFIPKENSKNGHAGYVKMPSTLYDAILKSGVTNYEPSFYVFGREGVPGEVAYGRNAMYRRHYNIAKALGINGGFYDWKHTGIYRAYLQGMRMKDISLQCRHADLNETDRYFNKNGFYHLERTFEFK